MNGGPRPAGSATLVLAVMAALCFHHVFAFGPLGHRAVALTAYRLAHPRTQQLIDALIPDAVGTMDVLAPRVDDFDHTEGGRWEAPQHYVSIETNATVYVPERDCPGLCVHSGVVNATALLRSTPRGPCIAPRHATALFNPEPCPLAFLIHLAGDIHQPLHASNQPDIGGNAIHVRYNWTDPGLTDQDLPPSSNPTPGHSANLHKIWDSSLINAAWPGHSMDERTQALSDELIAHHITPGNRAQWTQGLDPQAWVQESLELSFGTVRELLHEMTPESGTPYVYLRKEYYDQNLPIVTKRLAMASARLSALLDDIFLSSDLYGTTLPITPPPKSWTFPSASTQAPEDRPWVSRMPPIGSVGMSRGLGFFVNVVDPRASQAGRAALAYAAEGLATRLRETQLFLSPDPERRPFYSSEWPPIENPDPTLEMLTSNRPSSGVVRVNITITVPESADPPTASPIHHQLYDPLNSDEWYRLTIDAPYLQLETRSLAGVSRGFTTLAQLVRMFHPSSVPNFIPYPAGTVIEDEPRFPWRGLRLPTDTTWIPTNSILEMLDVMEASKLNVLHMPLVGPNLYHTSFIEDLKKPLARETLPAGQRERKNHRYSSEDLSAIAAVAASRSILFVPEWDIFAPQSEAETYFHRTWGGGIVDELTDMPDPFNDKALAFTASALARLTSDLWTANERTRALGIGGYEWTRDASRFMGSPFDVWDDEELLTEDLIAVQGTEPAAQRLVKKSLNHPDFGAVEYVLVDSRVALGPGRTLGAIRAAMSTARVLVEVSQPRSQPPGASSPSTPNHEDPLSCSPSEAMSWNEWAHHHVQDGFAREAELLVSVDWRLGTSPASPSPAECDHGPSGAIPSQMYSDASFDPIDSFCRDSSPTDHCDKAERLVKGGVITADGTLTGTRNLINGIWPLALGAIERLWSPADDHGQLIADVKACPQSQYVDEAMCVAAAAEWALRAREARWSRWSCWMSRSAHFVAPTSPGSCDLTGLGGEEEESTEARWLWYDGLDEEEEGEEGEEDEDDDDDDDEEEEFELNGDLMYYKGPPHIVYRESKLVRRWKERTLGWMTVFMILSVLQGGLALAYFWQRGKEERRQSGRRRGHQGAGETELMVLSPIESPDDSADVSGGGAQGLSLDSRGNNDYSDEDAEESGDEVELLANTRL